MNIFTAYLLPSIVALIMFSMGLALSVRDFAQVVQKPRAFAVGLMSQLLLLPALGFAVASLWPMPPVLAAGLMIIAACPGGAMSNLLTHLARGDTALSISLTAVISGLSVVTLPLVVGFSLPYFMGTKAPQLSLLGTIFGLSFMTLVPVSLGMAVRACVPGFALKVEPFARRTATVVFVMFIFAAIIMEWPTVRAELPAIAAPVLLLNLAAMTLAYGLAKMVRLVPDRVIALTLECGIQNGSLAMFVAATLLGNDTMMLPGAAYGLFMFPTAFLFVVFVLRGERRLALIKAEL
ncbi:hypothetical protein JCM17844_16650 [Iodidimonas gelatinilytica]|uniref:Bile acid:sodium symporter family protein n=1 Tax=Iodidimonas gelatinilytica TaxID=1236966 RepID=A0A5A7MSN1_9PROT|nr:bile acid:sodium symporter family protein [Iodidimonas gelatinilytica]GEQ98028.1 hypothetical protein JCM17844_16650 [Iodidimonas gelatinilytica]